MWWMKRHDRTASRADPHAPAGVGTETVMSIERRTLDLGDLTVPLEIRRLPQARRLTLTALATTGTLRLSMPRRVSLTEALAFIDQRRDWIAAAVDRWQPLLPIAPGTRIPVNGVETLIDWLPDAPRRVIHDGDRLVVGGPRARVAARVVRHLRAAALADLGARVTGLASAPALPRHARPLGRVGIGDPRARWGSCAASGDLRFSWRLILAPEPVRHYVAAHEVAHLAHMDHSQAFWSLAEQLNGGPVRPARAWLRQHGASLHRVVATPA